LDFEFSESLVEELGLEGDDFDFDLDDLIIPPKGDLGVSDDEFPSSWLDSAILKPHRTPTRQFLVQKRMICPD
jgi:hypothetical protein